MCWVIRWFHGATEYWRHYIKLVTYVFYCIDLCVRRYIYSIFLSLMALCMHSCSWGAPTWHYACTATADALSRSIMHALLQLVRCHVASCMHCCGWCSARSHHACTAAAGALPRCIMHALLQLVRCYAINIQLMAVLWSGVILKMTVNNSTLNNMCPPVIYVQSEYTNADHELLFLFTRWFHRIFELH